MIFVVTIVFLYFTATDCGPVLTTVKVQDILFNNTRRILKGNNVGDTRPYMVYLRPGSTVTPKELPDPNWLCGGVIIHERYILTSAACIENVKQFYVVSGTHRWLRAGQSNDCITNGAKKAIWKCVPKSKYNPLYVGSYMLYEPPRSYTFDGFEYDNIRWMLSDIAVVKVEDEFNFKKRVRGCDFIPKMVAYNNNSEEIERAGLVASVAGWGTDDKFTSADILPGKESGDQVPSDATRAGPTSLKESDVVIISKRNCKKRWPERYHHIIDKSMICTKDSSSDMSNVCTEDVVNCKELVYSEEQYTFSRNGGFVDQTNRRVMPDPERLVLHGAGHPGDTRRTNTQSGGFCENDHGGPLVLGQGKSAKVIGIISACQTRDLTHKCYGPFLYTSVYRNRHMINCAINKDVIASCRRLLRSMNTDIEKTYMTWGNGESKRSILRSRHREPESSENTTSTSQYVPQNTSRVVSQSQTVSRVVSQPQTVSGVASQPPNVSQTALPLEPQHVTQLPLHTAPKAEPESISADTSGET